MSLTSCIEKAEFCLGLIKLRTVFLMINDSVCRIFSLSLTRSLTVYGRKGDSNIFVCTEIVFMLFWFNDLV